MDRREDLLASSLAEARVEDAVTSDCRVAELKVVLAIFGDSAMLLFWAFERNLPKLLPMSSNLLLFCTGTLRAAAIEGDGVFINGGAGGGVDDSFFSLDCPL